MEARCKNEVADKMRGVRVILFRSGCDHLAMVLASPRAKGAGLPFPWEGLRGLLSLGEADHFVSHKFW